MLRPMCASAESPFISTRRRLTRRKRRSASNHAMPNGASSNRASSHTGAVSLWTLTSGGKLTVPEHARQQRACPVFGQRLVEVPALRRLHTRGAAVAARALGDQPIGVL